MIENVLSELPDWKGYFYRTSSGNEVDLILVKGKSKIAVECKASLAFVISKGLYVALDDLGIAKAFIIAPVDASYQYSKKVTVTNLEEFIELVKKH